MKYLGKAMAAGFIATVVLSALMVMKNMMGVMPELDLARMLSRMMGMPDTPAVGWVIHFMIGTVGYGAALALLHRHLPGESEIGHGMTLAFVGWLIMMVVLMPMAGAGFFALGMGWMAPMTTLVLHLVFGAILGWWFGRSVEHQPPHRLSRA